MKIKATSSKKKNLNIDWNSVMAYVAKCEPGTEFEIEVVKKHLKVSDPMRKLYFGHILSVYGEYLGYDREELELLHRQLKIVYFQIKADEKGIYRNVPSVFSNESDIQVSGKAKFVDWVFRVAGKDGCPIQT